MAKYVWLPLMLALMVTGCSSEENSVIQDDGNLAESTDQVGEDSPVDGKIGYSAMSLKNPFFVIISESLKEAGAAHGFDVITTDADTDVKKQANQIEDFISQGVDAIVLNPTDRLAIGPAIKKANEAGIPVFTCDLQCVAEGVEIDGHIGTDNFQGGELAGAAMVEVLGEEGGEVLILDFKQANSCVLRVDGFKKVLDAHNASTESGKITIVAEVNGGGDQDIGYKAAADSLKAHPNLRGIFAINDPAALGAWQAIKEADRLDVIQIVGFDGELAGKQAILEGKIYADPIQFPKQMGQGIIEKLLAYQAGEEYEKTTLIPTALYKQEDALKDPELKAAE